MDSDLDPNAFLQSVRELKEKRQKEDNERYEQLEAQIVQDREIRQARRLERERSLSPEKTTPQSARHNRASTLSRASTPNRASTPVNASPMSIQTSRSPSAQQPSARSPTRPTSMAAPEGRESPAPMDRSSSPSKPSPSGAMPSRSNTLSWQRRPNSISVRSRPLSAVASENSAARSPTRIPEPEAESVQPSDEPTSKEKIAESLSSKDPAWFRQTADRGLGSPAYRSSGDETPQHAPIARKQLPGMTQSTSFSVSSDAAPPSETPQEFATPRFGSVRGSPGRSRPLSMASISEQRMSESKSPIPTLDSQRFAPPSRERSSTADGEPPVVGRTMSNAQTRLATDRPASPTKGMGGFVQSAFMKRTDSVNKRWSAQPSTSLQRQDSTASSVPSRFGSVRDGASGIAGSRSMPRLDQSSDSPSRPSSSHSTISSFALGPDAEARDRDRDREPFVKPAGASHSRSKSVASINTIPDGLASPSMSPSKRWSPTKASWLESALTRPESPKPSPQSQPSWMAEINKAKQQRNSGETTLSQDNLDAGKAQAIPKTDVLKNAEILAPSPSKRASFNDPETQRVSSRIVTPPTKAKPASLSLIGKPTKDTDIPKEMEQAKPTPVEEPVAVTVVDTAADTPKLDSEKQPSIRHKPAALSSPFMSPNLDSPKSHSATSSKHSSFSSFPPKPDGPVDAPSQPAVSPKPSSFISPKPKPNTPPKKDFRSGLKSRTDLSNAPKTEEPEFKSMFGKLKKANAEKYVAPDELKSNVLRGKAGLAISTGPQKSERRDDLRDSLLKKKDEIKTKAVDVPPQKISPAPRAALPEALTMKGQLGRSGSTVSIPSPDRQRRDVTPEALSLHKTLRSKQRAPSPEKTVTPVEKKPFDVKPLKPTSLDIKTPETKSLGIGSQDVKSSESSSPATKPVERKPFDIKPLKPASLATKTPDTKSLDNKSQDINPSGSSPLATKPFSSKPSAAKPFEDKSAEFTPTRSKSVKTEPLEIQPVDIKPSKTWSTEQEEPSPEKQSPPPSTAALKAAPASSKIADRFNPALAGILARGPMSQPATPRSSSPPLRSSSTTAASDEASGSQLTHMTKSRAKGPKRRKPNAKGPTTETIAAERPSSSQHDRIKDVQPASSQTKTPLQPAPKSASVRAASLRLSSGQFSGVGSSSPSFDANELTKDSTEEEVAAKIDPPVSKAPLKAIASLSSVGKPSNSPRQQPAEPMKASGSRSPSINNPKSASTVALTEPSDSTDPDKENGGSVKSAAAMWGSPAAQRLTPQKRGSPIPLPTKKDEEAAMKSAGLLSSSNFKYRVATPPRGLGISDSPLPIISKRDDSSEGPLSPSNAMGMPPRPAKSSRVVSASLSSKDLPALPDPKTTKAGIYLTDFFGEIPYSNQELRLDTQAILSERPGDFGPIKTLRRTIHEITGDGKTTALPAQEEHVLYEESMYVCTHVFGSGNGTKTTEAYLWSGLGVSESSVQDAQLFAKRIAKDAGAGQRSTPLIIVDQGREPAAFFQALGGIVIVRRGSRAESSTRPYMLCGRPHMGHLAFDEVDLSKASLCSDFPYIIARPVTLQETKVYLWKGKSYSPEVVGSARLIGMDLNPSGEIIEVDEGREPRDLLLLMSDLRSPVCASPEMWTSSKKLWEHSSARIFRVYAASPKLVTGNLFASFMSRRPSWSASKNASPERPASASSTAQEVEFSVKEISPFTQTDLEPEGCFVMDCGHSVLVLPGPLLSKQPHYRHIFTQALLFAHDYVILSASIEDRPGLPSATVIFDGLPRDAQLCFRRWDKARGAWGTGGMMAGRRLDGLEVQSEPLGIREALELCCKR